MWNINDEIAFFENALNGSFANVKDLFYEFDGRFFAYAPRSIKRTVATLQSRNSLIGNYTELWCEKLFAPIARAFGLYAVRGITCRELGMVGNAKMDLGFCTSEDKIQKAENVKIILKLR